MSNPATPEPELAPEQIAAKELAEQIKSRFEDQEARFVEIEAGLKILREFFIKHREAIAPFQWTCYGSSLTISFNCAYGNKDKQKEIARAFGSSGWKRVKNEYTCGRIDWKKTVDGVEIEIDCAEQINPKLIEEVKL